MEDNAWEAWRKFIVHFERSSAAMKGQTMAAVGKLSDANCKNPQETSILMLELDRRIRGLEDITGKSPGGYWLVSIVSNAMDDQTKTHCSGCLKTDTDFMR